MKTKDALELLEPYGVRLTLIKRLSKSGRELPSTLAEVYINEERVCIETIAGCGTFVRGVAAGLFLKQP